jgi:hypothetical protein
LVESEIDILRLTPENFKIKFGQPKHGWLPVDLNHNDFELQFTASRVLVNPVDELISAILQITKGISTEIWWNLEAEAVN